MLGSALLAAPAHAAPADHHAGSTGRATAVAAHTELNVSVLGGTKVPVTATLNSVSAPADERETLLTAKVNGAHKGRPVRLVKAEVAASSAKADAQRAVGDVKLVSVRAYAPGLLLKPLLSADLLTANASCVAGQKPVATADLEKIAVFGKPVEIKALQGSSTKNIKVPGVGTVELALEEEVTTTSTAAATALRLTYTVSPANLGVAKVSGELVLAKATCETPGGSGGDSGGSGTEGPTTGGDSGSTGGDTTGNSGGSEGQTGGSEGTEGTEGTGTEGSETEGPSTQTGEGNLAETGSSSVTPIIAGVGAATLLVGGGVMYLLRRRGAAQS